MNRALINYSPETEVFEATAPASAVARAGDVSEVDRTELAARLLEVSNEAELDRFLDTLMSRTAQPARTSIHEPVARALKVIFRSTARSALPEAGRAMTQTAGRLFGLELEGLSPEDQELEIAKGFVRFAHEATQNAAAAPNVLPVHTVARAAVIQAAKHLAPGLLRKLARTESTSRRSHASTSVEETIMHDIDRTQMETQPETEEFESEEFEYDTFGEMESEEEAYGESLLSEAEEVEFAGELLAVNSEAELDLFIVDAIKKVAKKAGAALRSSAGQTVARALKAVAKKALPLAGGALGGWVGGPLGAKIGSGLASAAGSALGLEAETLEQEDLEFEGAKQFVRLAADTVQRAVAAPVGADPTAVAQKAVVAAARNYAPGLLGRARSAGVGASMQRGRSGRWLRRGNKIVLLGV